MYRKASADLLLARDLAGQADTAAYLETLVGRAYTAIYSARRLRLGSVLRYFSHAWPRTLREEKAYVLVASAVFALGFLVAFVLTLADPVAFDHLLPSEWAVSYAERPDDPRAERFGTMGDEDAAAFSSMLMVNNIRVTIRAFALGLTFGVGTVAMLFFNGVLLGAIAANFAGWGQSLEFWALIAPHGVPEIFAIVLGGGGGLVLADALLRPGRRSRIQALRDRGRRALSLVGAAVPLLVIAGLIEGFVTPMAILPPVGKLVFAAVAAVALGLWIRAPWLPSEAPES